MDTDFEALVAGGAAAGLSAGLVLGRPRVRSLVVDAGLDRSLEFDQAG